VWLVKSVKEISRQQALRHGFQSLAFHGSHRSEPGEFALVQTESAISFHGSIRSPVGVVFYGSNIN